MYNIDDLIRDIHKDEALELPGIITEEQLHRIETRVLSTIHDKEPLNPRGYRKLTNQKRLVLLLSAALILLLGITSFAAVQNEWDIALINFMGISDADTLQLEDGQVQINKSAEYQRTGSGAESLGIVEKPIQMTATTSIGDKNSVYIRIETDYVMPDSYNQETDYILSDDFNLDISPMESGYGATHTCFVEDGKLGFLLSITNCEKINKCQITFEMTDLYLHHDQIDENTEIEKELLCAGTWTMSWKFNYKSNVKSYRMLETFESNGVTYYLTKVEISPISIYMEAFRMPQDRDKPEPGALLETIYFEDGTSLSVPHQSSFGIHDRMYIDSFVDVETLGNPINSNKVESLTICGKRIKLR